MPAAAISGVVFLLAIGQTASASVPHAVTFSVNTTEDSVDAAPGDGACEDATGKCSLRAAVMVFGAALTIAGVVLFATKPSEGETSAKILGVEVTVMRSGLARMVP